MITTKLGLKMEIDPKHSRISRQLETRGVYESSETALLWTLLRPGDVCLDVGAHIGYYTLIMAKAVGRSGRVVAIEPGRRTFALLKRNVTANDFDQVTVLNLAVGDELKKVSLYLDPRNSGDSRLFNADGRRSGERTTVVPIDRLISREVRFDIVKIDAQGYESRILRGARLALSASRQVKLMIEFWPFGLHASGSSPREFFNILDELGFKYFLISAAKKLALANRKELEKMRPLETSYVNLFCRRV